MLFVAAIAAILFWTLAAMLFEEKFIYFPQKYPQGPYDQARSIPRLQDCWITTSDGVKIHGWYAPAESAKATFVMSHGNAGNISHRYLLLRSLQRHGYSVLMYDYRGYGRSEGSPSEEGVYADGIAAYNYVLTLPGVDSSRTFLWGTSLGGAIAVDVATHRTAPGLIMESTFTSAKDVARTVYPFLPVHLILRTKFNSSEKIKSLHIPILVIHGSHDTVIPVGLGRRLFQAANEPKELYEIPGANHDDTFFVGGEEYYSHIDRFVASALHPPTATQK
jgi:fermentation-respiration switch protein FrsA (DUF1100 family)